MEMFLAGAGHKGEPCPSWRQSVARLWLMTCVAARDLWTNKATASVLILSMACGMSVLAGLLSVIEGQRKDMELILNELGGAKVVRAVLYSRDFSSASGVDWRSLLQWADAGITQDEGAMVKISSSAVEAGGLPHTLASIALADMDVRGVTHTFQEFGAVDVIEGRFLSEWDSVSRSRVCVVGQRIAESLGDRTLGATLYISGQGFDVVGRLSPKGQLKHAFSGAISAWKDSLVLIPFGVALEGFPGSIPMAEMCVRADRNGNPVKRFPLREGTDFSMQTNQWVVRIYANVVKRMMPGVWAIISLCVFMACVGVVNVMVSGIRERMVEIGVRRSVGASSSDIVAQFVAEAGICGLIGSGVGWIMGEATSRVVMHFAQLPRAFGLWAFLLCILAGPITGMIAGLTPALKARRIHPVDALREE